MRKKGSIKIFETIMVVFIFIVMIIVGMSFFERYTKADIANDAMEFAEWRLHSLRATMPETSELVCTEFGHKQSCMDSYRMVAFSSLAKSGYQMVDLSDPTNNIVFADLLKSRYGAKNITVKVIYPEDKVSEEVCTQANMVDCGQWNLYDNVPSNYKGKIVVNTPVTIYYPDSEDYSIGVMRIEEYVLY
jgi:hypothetical protein